MTIYDKATLETRLVDGHHLLGQDLTDVLDTVYSACQPKCILLEDTAAEGTGRTSAGAGAWFTRPLSTLVQDDTAVATLVSNQFSVPAGKYVIDASGTFYAVNRCRIRLYNVTDSVVIAQGTIGFSNASCGTISDIRTTFTIAATKTLRIEYWTEISSSTNDFGVVGDSAGWGTELFTRVLLQKYGP